MEHDTQVRIIELMAEKIEELEDALEMRGHTVSRLMDRLVEVQSDNVKLRQAAKKRGPGRPPKKRGPGRPKKAKK